MRQSPRNETKKEGYRDMETLRASGADIGGERGLGFTLIDDGSLRPRTFSRIEIEALTLGLAQVRQMGDPSLAAAATLPSAGQQHVLHAVSRVHQFDGQTHQDISNPVDMDLIRQACWREEELEIGHTDRNRGITRRASWPLAIVYLDRMLVLLARSRMREDFRIFRVARITAASATAASFRPRRAALLRTHLALLDENSKHWFRHSAG